MECNISMDITCGKHYDDGEYCRFAFQAICEYCRPGKLCLYCNCCGGSGRHPIYRKLLRLGSSYKEKAQTSEIVQISVEGVEQLETYFGAYLPQFFYAMLAPLTLFIVLGFVNVPAAAVLLVCVPLIPAAIAAVQTGAKTLLSK